MPADGPVLITGANGFVGTALGMALGDDSRPATRAERLPGGVLIPTLDGVTDWRAALRGCRAVVHLAARVHHTSETADAAMMQYRQTNCAATLNLAEQAAQAGIRRFLFISTAKVHGEGRSTPYRESDALAPVGAYAVSKAEAETGLLELSRRTGMPVTILRPPLVYGPGVRANFLQLMRLADRGLPFPLASVRNRRSIVSVANLVSAIEAALADRTPEACSFLVADEPALSTAALIRHMALALGRPDRLWSFPLPWLSAAAKMLGRSEQLDKLTGTFTLDTTRIREQLGWQQVQSTTDALAETALWYRAQKTERQA